MQAEATNSSCSTAPLYYGSQALYICGASPVIGVLRTGNALFRLFQLHLILKDPETFEIAMHQHQDDEDVKTADKCAMYKKPTEMKKFYLWEIARGISEIILPVIAALFWVYKDISYERPEGVEFPEDLAPATSHNLFGWDELKVLNTGVAALRSFQKNTMQPLKEPVTPLI